MGKIILQEFDVDELRDAIVSEVVAQLTSAIQRASGATPTRIANREQMAQLLGWSIAKLDRRTAEGALVTILDDGRRSYLIEESIEKLRAATPAAEEKARQRQAAKRAAKSTK